MFSRFLDTAKNNPFGDPETVENFSTDVAPLRNSRRLMASAAGE